METTLSKLGEANISQYKYDACFGRMNVFTDATDRYVMKEESEEFDALFKKYFNSPMVELACRDGLAKFKTFQAAIVEIHKNKFSFVFQKEYEVSMLQMQVREKARQ